VHSARSPYGLHTTKEKVGGAYSTKLRGCFWGLSSLARLDYTVFVSKKIAIKEICSEPLSFN